MSTITSGELRKRFATIGCKIKIRTVNFTDLARCSAAHVDVIMDGDVRTGIYFSEAGRMRWEPVNALIRALGHIQLEVKGDRPRTIVFS